MTTDDGAIRRAAEILRAAVGERLREGEPLAPMTSFRIGGPAALYLDVESASDLERIAEARGATGIPLLVIGKGSNLLIADEGFAGLVIRLGRSYRWAARDGARLRAGGSMPLPALAGVALGQGLGGLEFGVAIPASVGGSVRMNAGAHGHAIEEVLDTAEVFDCGTGGTRSMGVDELGFRYRSSAVPPLGVVIAATFLLEPRADETIRKEMEEARAWRRATQPLAEPTCGSVFKNPPDGHAARLIEEAGGKELSVGGARVSEKHANFIVTGPGATAEDVRRLMDLVRERVRERFGIELEAEVHLVGPA